MADQFLDWFWTHGFWLPGNFTWKDLEPSPDICTPQTSDFKIAFGVACGLFVLRLFWERFVAYPIGRWHGVKERCIRPPRPNLTLEMEFQENRQLPCGNKIEDLSQQLDMTTRQIERWWRRKRAQEKPTEMTRFKETSWRCFFYWSALIVGVYVLWDKKWFWSTKYCWDGYPRHHIPPEIYWYYMVELGFYLSLMMSLSLDHKRKDFWEMTIHHIATLFLMFISWICNFVRIGALVLVLHDTVDPFLESAKLVNYLGYKNMSSFFFVIFTIIWFITRDLLFPLWLIRSSIFESYYVFGVCGSVILENSLLLVLCLLHINWTYFIVKMLNSFIRSGQLEKDARSETEPESDTESDDINTDKNKVTTNYTTPNGSLSKILYSKENGIQLASSSRENYHRSVKVQTKTTTRLRKSNGNTS